jgi:hypothetical protein
MPKKKNPQTLKAVTKILLLKFCELVVSDARAGLISKRLNTKTMR